MSSPSPTPDKCREARRRRRIQLMRRYSTSPASPMMDRAASLPPHGLGLLGPGSRSTRRPATGANIAAVEGARYGNEHHQRMKIMEHGTRGPGTSLARTMSLPQHSSAGLSVTTTTTTTTTEDRPPAAHDPPVPLTWLCLGIGSATTDVVAEDHVGPVATIAAATASPRGVPRFGSVSQAGRCREMEDAVTVKPCFYPPKIEEQQIGGAGVAAQQFHFFAVFDGHGGSHVSSLCKDRMHELLAEELANAATPLVLSPSTHPPHRPPFPDAGTWHAALRRCFARADQLALASCTCGGVGGSGSCACCRCDRLQAGGLGTYIVGSTAVVAVVGECHIVVANCGDSRAVMGRGGRAVALSVDHKPDRPDELARIEEAGGKVIHLNGAPRVMGILAMSRAIGDKYLKPAVISEPDITITDRTAEDECLIIASDGLWDVLSNDVACNIVRNCLNDTDVPGTNGSSTDGGGRESSILASDERCTLAATLLTRMALGRMCRDDISVIVVDLRRTQI